MGRRMMKCDEDNINNLQTVKALDAETEDVTKWIDLFGLEHYFDHKAAILSFNFYKRVIRTTNHPLPKPYFIIFLEILNFMAMKCKQNWWHRFI